MTWDAATIDPAHAHERPAPRGASALAAAGAIFVGCAITLVVHGYQFGLSNHSVYLIDALRKADPALLANDWFYTRTLQYHSVFGWLTAGLLRAGVLEEAFVAIYGALVLGLHFAWRSIARSMGGDDRVYLLSVVLYAISAGGMGLGAYQFLQDSAVLASNVANVAMLAGVAAILRGRWIAAGAALGLAGMFHLNHAVVACLLWAFVGLWSNRLSGRWFDGRFVAGSFLLAGGCLANIVPAAVAKLGHPETMPLAEWVDLFVRLRHPHHYDPSSWPWALWLAFVIWVPPAAAALWAGVGQAHLPFGWDRHSCLSRRSTPSLSPRSGGQARMSVPPDEPPGAPPGVPAAAVIVFFLALQLVALLFAGLTYVSETLVQMSLYRFSIIPHLMMVTLAAGLLAPRRAVVWALPALLGFALAVALLSPMAAVARERFASIAALIVLAAAPAAWRCLDRRRIGWMAGLTALAGVLIGWRAVAGLTMPLVTPDRDYLALCEWTRQNTPADAVFLVPPYEEAFRWHARRAIVINWKSPPQLAGELPEWRDRMAATLGWSDLSLLPRGSYVRAVEAMKRRFDETPPDALAAAAAKYHARYVVATRDLGPEYASRRAGPAFGRYLLYDLSR